MKKLGRIMTGLVIAAAAVGSATETTNAGLTFSTAAYTWKGVVWSNGQTDYGTSENQQPTGVSGNNELRTTDAGALGGFVTEIQGAAGGGANNLAAANKTFWETMRTSSIAGSAGPQSSPWISWTVLNNYSMGTSQNDGSINGVGGTATSVASGTLSPEPGAFGGDRLGIGSGFGNAYEVAHKGTGNGTNDQFYRRTPGGTGNGDFSSTITANEVVRPGLTYAYNATQYEAVKYTVGKRLDGTLDVIVQSPSLLSGTILFTSTYSKDNANWFFYQIELRARGGNPAVNTVQTYTDFAFGNNWGTLTSQIPEPASLGLLGLGSLMLVARRRKTA